MPAMRVLFLMICLPPRALRLTSLGVGLFHGLFVAGLLGFCLFNVNVLCLALFLLLRLFAAYVAALSLERVTALGFQAGLS